jgi:nucleoside-diphosphate-sugar epimerase
MKSDFSGPVNIGSDEQVSINELAQMAIDISGKDLRIKNIPTDVQGVRSRNSENTLIHNKLGWKPSYPLRDGMEKTYRWIERELIK